jgi:hypothetical protein
MGGAPGSDAAPINAVALFLVPIAAVLILRMRLKK